MKVRRAIFLVLVLAFIILPCWWVFHFPFRPELVCRVIPADATLATRHIAPADRWMAFARSPAITNIAVEFGADAAAIEQSLNSAGLSKVVDLLGSRYVVTGLVPSLGVRSEKALVFGAWVGGYSQFLRWGLIDRHLGDFSAHKIMGNRRVWFRPCNELRTGYHISLTVHEGVLVGCFSSEPLGVLYCLPNLQRQLPPTPLVQEWCEDTGTHELLDAFKARVTPPGEAGRASVVIRGGFTDLSSERVSVIAELPPASDLGELGRWMPLDPSGFLSAQPGTPPAILGHRPTIITATPVQQAGRLVTSWNDTQVTTLWSALQNDIRSDGDVYLFACGGDYYGRMMRMKVPSFGLVAPMVADADGASVVRRMLDSMNAVYGWGVVSTPDTHDPRIYVVDSVRSDSFKKLLGANERPAIAVHDGWLIAMSNVDVLRRILSGANAGDVQAAWGSGLAEHNASVYGWADLEDSSDLMIKALAGYTLASLMQSGSSSPKRHDTARTKAMIRATGKLNRLVLWGSPGNDRTILRAELTLVDRGDS